MFGVTDQRYGKRKAIMITTITTTTDDRQIVISSSILRSDTVHQAQ